MTSRRWTLILFVLAAVFSLGLAACGDDEPEVTNTIDDAGDAAGDAADDMGEAVGEAADEAGDALGVVAGDPEAGAAVFAEQGCSGCHAVEEGVEGMTGPPLHNIATVANERTEQSAAEYIRESITNPSAHVVEGYENVMPPYELPDDQLDNLVAYLMTLTGE
jgi:mono/diheme cytochrome c family protein